MHRSAVTMHCSAVTMHHSAVTMHRSAVTMQQFYITLNYVHCLNLAPLEKLRFITPMKYSSNEKGIMAPMECTPMAYSTNAKDMVL